MPRAPPNGFGNRCRILSKGLSEGRNKFRLRALKFGLSPVSVEGRTLRI